MKNALFMQHNFNSLINNKNKYYINEYKTIFIKLYNNTYFIIKFIQ